MRLVIYSLISAHPSPGGAVINHPAHQGFLKADVIPGLLGLEPFVAQDLLSFCMEFSVESRSVV